MLSAGDPQGEVQVRAMLEWEPEWKPNDPTGRFRLRPMYSLPQLNKKAGHAIMGVLRRCYGDNLKRAVSTDDLITLLRDLDGDIVEDVEFPPGPAWIQGFTDFRPARPCVRIARGLPENRRKSTIAHETGHVLTLKDAYALPANVLKTGYAFRCGEHNWMEWQGDECIGIFLTPSQILEMLIGPVDREQSPPAGSAEGAALIRRISGFFEVSRELAAVRLRNLGYLRPPQYQYRLPFNGVLSLEA